MNKQKKEIIKIFLFLFVAVSLMIHWDSASWIFNYRVISSLTHDFFYPYEDSPLLVSASQKPKVNQFVIKKEQLQKYPYTEKTNSLEIISLGVNSPVIISPSQDQQAILKSLEDGAVYYADSSYPGLKGQTIVLGHSAPRGWPKIKHDWIFSDIDNLSVGESIIFNFNHRQYKYEVIDREIIKAGEDIPADSLEQKNNMLVLVSCWPPGKAYKRIAVRAKLID